MENHLPQLPPEVTHVTSTHILLVYVNHMNSVNFIGVKYNFPTCQEADKNQKYWWEAIKATP